MANYIYLLYTKFTKSPFFSELYENPRPIFTNFYVKIRCLLDFRLNVSHDDE